VEPTILSSGVKDPTVNLLFVTPAASFINSTTVIDRRKRKRKFIVVIELERNVSVSAPSILLGVLQKKGMMRLTLLLRRYLRILNINNKNMFMLKRKREILDHHLSCTCLNLNININGKDSLFREDVKSLAYMGKVSLFHLLLVFGGGFILGWLRNAISTGVLVLIDEDYYNKPSILNLSEYWVEGWHL
jgi:hypothetical protein